MDSLRIAATPSLDDHLFTAEDHLERGALAPIAAKVLMKVLYGARMCRPDLLFAVCSLAREVTRWTRACDKRLHRLICYIQGTKNVSLYSTVNDSLDTCLLLLYTDADVAGTLARGGQGGAPAGKKIIIHVSMRKLKLKFANTTTFNATFVIIPKTKKT